MRGNVKINSINSEIKINGDAKNIELQTISSNTLINGKSEFIEALSINGNIKVNGEHDSVKIKTTSGEINYDSNSVNKADFYSTSGTLNLTFKTLNNSNVQIDTLSSPLFISFPKNASSLFKITNINGKVLYNKSDFDEASLDEKKYTLKKGKGSSMIFVESMSSTVKLEGF